MGKKEWLGLFKSLVKRKERLEAPPRENSRDRESYIGLRDLVLADASVRRAFLAVHWKGRPSGLALLGQLLSAGTLAPEFDTDADSLEAELAPLGATTKLKKLSADERGASLMAVMSGSPHPQARSSYTRLSVAFRASAVVFRQRSRVRLFGSVMMRVARLSIAGNVRCL